MEYAHKTLMIADRLHSPALKAQQMNFAQLLVSNLMQDQNKASRVFNSINMSYHFQNQLVN